MSWWNTEMSATISGIALILLVIALVLGKKIGPLRRLGSKGIEFGAPTGTDTETLNMPINPESIDLEDVPIKVKDLEKHCDKVQVRIIEKLNDIKDELNKVEKRLCSSIGELKDRVNALEKTVSKLLG